jgi:hypothetical protein
MQAQGLQFAVEEFLNEWVKISKGM